MLNSFYKPNGVNCLYEQHNFQNSDKIVLEPVRNNSSDKEGVKFFLEANSTRQAMSPDSREWMALEQSIDLLATEVTSVLSAVGKNYLGMIINYSYGTITVTFEENGQKSTKNYTPKSLKDLCDNNELIDSVFNLFGTALKVSKISNQSFYPEEKDEGSLVSSCGSVPLDLTKGSHAALEQKKACNNITEACKSWTEWKKKPGRWKSFKQHFKKPTYAPALSFIDKMEQEEQGKKGCEAVKSVLLAEMLVIKFKKNLEAKIEALEKGLQGANEDKKGKLQLEFYKQFMGQLGEVDRYALYVAAANLDISDPEKCYENVLEGFYEELCGGDKNKMTIEQFKEDQKFKPILTYVAELSSMLITDPAKYRVFCSKHNISPGGNHINRLLLFALQGTEKNEIRDNLDDYYRINVDAEAKQEILNYVKDNLLDLQKSAVKFFEKYGPWQPKKEETLEQFMKTVLDDPEYKKLLS